MEVKFVTVERSLVDTVPIADGQVVVCRDSSDMYYDMGQTRRRVGPAYWQPVEDDWLTTGFTMTDGTIGVIQLVPNEGPDTQLMDAVPANFLYGTVGELVGLTTLPVLEREGYEFLGWYEDQTGQSTKVETFPSKFTSGKTRYYASWAKK